MDSERWKRIDEIFHAALKHEPSERAAFLAEVCEDDSLRVEVEQLVATHEKQSTFFENPASDLAAEFLAKQRDYKETIAHFRIVKKIGSGGMGEVYLADDTRLNRKVALKLLPPEFSNDKERIHRFEREARAVSALNHPNILTIYDIGQVDSSSFIASEYIEGETLRQRMRVSRIPLKEILAISIQVAEALEAAHRAGIIHRDIKPENIMLRKDGYVKVLDFGLAKLMETHHVSQISGLDTHSFPDITETGIAIGTIRYMSPEQARGLKVDARTDIFSLGVVLYEMIAGRAPFDGATSPDLLVAILEKYPPALRTYGELPDELQWIVTKALAKDVEERYQTTKELLTDLRRLRKQLDLEQELKRFDVSDTTGSESKGRHHSNLFKFIGITLLLIAGFATFKFLSQKYSTQVNNKPLNQRQITFSGKALDPEISPDGKFVAFYEPPNQIFVQSLTGGNPLRVSDLGDGVEGVRWSPDSKQLLILMSKDDVLNAFTISLFGGQRRPLTQIGPVVSWSHDGTRLASTAYAEKGISISSLKEPNKISNINIRLPREFRWIYDIDWSSNGRFALSLQTDNESLIATIEQDGSRQEIVVTEPLGTIDEIRWSWNSKSIYYWKSEENQPSALMKIEISPDSGKAVGSPKLILSDLNPISGLSFSRNGILSYSRHFHKSNIWALHLNNSTSQWSKNQLTQGTSLASSPSISPDGSTVAFNLTRAATSIFTVPVSGGDIKQLTFEEDTCRGPAWSPGGKILAAVCNHNGALNIVIISEEGSTLNYFKSIDMGNRWFVTWAPGNSILYQLSGNRNFNFLDPKSGKKIPLLKETSRGWIFNSLVSPDQLKAVSYVNWQNNRGIWIENLSDHTGTLLVKGSSDMTMPFGWSSDSMWIYITRLADKNPEVIISKINIDNKKEIILPRLPLHDGESIQSISMAQNENTFAAAISEHESDVWITENFDPEDKD